MQLAYLAPDVLVRLVTHRVPTALSPDDLIAAAKLPWSRTASTSSRSLRSMGGPY